VLLRAQVIYTTDADLANEWT